MDIDLVYTWCNDNDNQWHQKRQQYQKGIVADEQAVCTGRFVQNNELKYSLRSVEKYMPWVRRIYIVSDNQTPEWLNTDHPKITMVNHEQIIDEKYLPLFNSSAIEIGLPYIPGLSEHFLYMNDDEFINAPVQPDDFFTSDDKIIWRANVAKEPLKLTQYVSKIISMRDLAQNIFATKYPLYYPHHNIDAYHKSDFIACNQLVPDLLQKTQSHRFRDSSDWQRSLVYYYSINKNHGMIKYVDEYRYSLKAWLKHYFIEGGHRDSTVLSLHCKDYERKLKRQKPLFFCLEDGEKVHDEDRIRGKAFMESYFPDKSSFEK